MAAFVSDSWKDSSGGCRSKCCPPKHDKYDKCPKLSKHLRSCKQGPQGERGERGPQGERGACGPRGLPGPPGPSCPCLGGQAVHSFQTVSPIEVQPELESEPKPMREPLLFRREPLLFRSQKCQSMPQANQSYPVTFEYGPRADPETNTPGRNDENNIISGLESGWYTLDYKINYDQGSIPSAHR